RWAIEQAELEIERALDGVLRNLPARPAAWVLRPLVLPLGRRSRGPDDELGADVAALLLDDPEVRERLTRDVYIPPPEEPGLGRLEAALAKARDALPVEAKIRAALRAGRLDHAPGHRLADLALEAGIIDAE